MPKFIGLDTETVIRDHIHTFFSFQLYSEDITFLRGENEVYSTKELEFERYLTNKTDRAWFVCFNLSFDGIVISRVLKNINEGNERNKRSIEPYLISCVLAGSRITRVTIQRGKLKWILCDLRNIFPNTSLEMVGTSIKIPKMDKPAYLGLRAPKTLEERIYFRKYAINDAKVCYKGAKMVYNEFKTFRTTCAGLAIRVFKRDYVKFKNFHHDNDVTENKYRLAYHGGRTECFIRGTNPEKISGYDINSLYPYVMKMKTYPDVRRKGKYKTDVDLDNEGLAHVRITCDHVFPPICIKKICADNIEKLVFPNGNLIGWFTYPELRAIEDNNLGKITDVYEAIEWNMFLENENNPMAKFATEFYAKKQEATKTDSPKKNLYKIMLNSTYGKFGEHGSCRFITLDGVDIIEDREAAPKTAWYHSPVLAGYITAYARLENWQYLRHMKPERIYYTDTDCFYTSEDLTRYCSSKIGALKKEVTIERGNSIFIRSKFYAVNERVVLKGFSVNIPTTEFVKMLYREDFSFPQHRILKMLEAKRLGKIPLTDCTIIKTFDVSPDGKRYFAKPLTSKDLFANTSLSTPLDFKD